jgi:hypothetical protein
MSALPLAQELRRFERSYGKHTPIAARRVHDARARGLTAFASLDGRGGPWPAWVRKLRRRSGCYVIRDARTHQALYVGSSATDLYRTLTRHFQDWRRGKDSNRYYRRTGHDPGIVLPRDRCEAAVQLVTTAGDLHRKTEAALIARFRPIHNLVEHPDGGEVTLGELDEVPF